MRYRFEFVRQAKQVWNSGVLEKFQWEELWEELELRRLGQWRVWRPIQSAGGKWYEYVPIPSGVVICVWYYRKTADYIQIPKLKIVSTS